jgi:hypothetical protein
MDPYMALNGSRFMVTWTLFKHHLLKADQTQNRETTALRTLTATDSFYLIIYENPRE